MSVKVVIGAQWGDEGKGKLVDVLSENADIVLRYQGGANAGHTVYIDDQKYILHLIPGGILRPTIQCVIGNGVVMDPVALFEEIKFLESQHIGVNGRLFISNRTHVIFPYHKILDQAEENNLETKKIGTTGRGIGPAYIDKVSRCGIRVGDLFEEVILREKLKANLEKKRKILGTLYHQDMSSFEKIYDQARYFAEQLQPYVIDTTYFINQAWKAGKEIILEGAQGCLLDVDFGSYPYVTSSNPTVGGAITGSGLPPMSLTEIVGVFKAYQTRVGSGPFPSEDLSDLGAALRETGQEYGATTGRPRRCGWLDLVAANYAIIINGFTSLALTKLDVLDSFDEIKVCISYQCADITGAQFPAHDSMLAKCKPVYRTFPGWKRTIGTCTRFDELPEKARNYINFLEETFNTPIKYICVGKERKQIIQR
jgi:adenylosuccinate synthase